MQWPAFCTDRATEYLRFGPDFCQTKIFRSGPDRYLPTSGTECRNGCRNGCRTDSSIIQGTKREWQGSVIDRCKLHRVISDWSNEPSWGWSFRCSTECGTEWSIEYSIKWVQSVVSKVESSDLLSLDCPS